MGAVIAIPPSRVGGWSSRTRIIQAPVALRLRLDDEATLRFVFNDWEGVAGVRSNYAAQVEALANGLFRRAVALETRREQRRKERSGSIRIALATGNLSVRKKVPLALRGWPTVSAKPTRVGAGGFPMRTVTVPGDRVMPDPCIVTVAAPEEWALMPRSIPGPQGPIRRRRVVEMFRALRRVEEKAGGGRMLVVLHLLYGPRSPMADYLVFGELAPIVHMTSAARETVRTLTTEDREAFAEHIVAPDAPERDVRVAAKADAQSWEVSARTAVDRALHTWPKERRKELRDRLAREAGLLRTRAHNALRDAMEAS